MNTITGPYVSAWGPVLTILASLSMKRILTPLLFTLLAFIGTTLSASAADYFARGVAYCILDDGSGTFPIDEAGEVFVGTTPDEAPSWTAGSHASTVVTGPMTGGQAPVKFYYWARAKEGYTFLGWGSTKTSKTVNAGTERLEGQSWESKTTLWSAGTEAAPKEAVRYAIFRKNAAEDTTGGGVKLESVTGNTHIFGSTTSEWSVRLNYQAPLAYRDFAGYADGYGTNKGLIASITCKSQDTGAPITVKNARVGGSPTAEGTDAYGLIFFPADMPVGTYSVHVPKGLFTTSLGMVTAAADFELTVTPDETPFTIKSTTPEEGYAWDASEATQAKETDGNFSTITLTFNKIIAHVNTEGKEIILTNTNTGRISKATICSVSATTNKYLGVIAFDSQPSGTYTFDLPAGVFFDAAGNGNEAFELHFSISGSRVPDWELPTYSSVVASPSNNATVEELSEVSFAFSRAGYAEPQQLYLNTAVSATKIREIYKDGVNYNDPDARPEIQSEDIEGVSLDFEDGLLKVRFAQPVTEATKVVVAIPAKAVINLNAWPGTPDQTLYEKGGCTNAPLQLTIVVKPAIITGIDAAAAAEPLGQQMIFTADGKRTNALLPGVNIVRTIRPDGSSSVRKVIKQ